MKVRKGMVVFFNAVGWDRFDRNANTPDNGAIVRVCTPYGCPPPNTMGHCFVETLEGEFIGLVSTASLTPAAPKLKKIAAERAAAAKAFDDEYLGG
jgi:hypothetical protein